MRQKIVVFSCVFPPCHSLCVGEYEDNRQCQWIHGACMYDKLQFSLKYNDVRAIEVEQRILLLLSDNNHRH